MSTAKFDAARELIKEKKYNEARAILRTVDHPKAIEWIGRINDLQWAETKPAAKPSAQQGLNGANFLAFVSVIVIGIMAFGFVYIQHTPTTAVLPTATFEPTSTRLPPVTNTPVVVTATPNLPTPEPVSSIPLVPAVPSSTRLDQIVNKCTGVIQRNPGLYKALLDNMIKDIYSGKIDHLGTTAYVLMGRYCTMPEAFEVAWVTYSMVVANDSALNSRNRTSVWSDFAAGWNFAFGSNTTR